MTSPDDRASDGDRRDAKKVVEAALASGRIIQADRDRRVDMLEEAKTMMDIDIVIRDLTQVGHTQHVGPGQAVATAAAMSVPAGTTPPAAGQQWPLVNYGPAPGQAPTAAQVSATVGKAGKAIGGIIAAVVLVAFVIPIAGVAIAFFSARDSFTSGPFAEPTDETTYPPGQEPGENGINLHTVNGYDDLEAAVLAETGATDLYQLVIYPRYAVMDIPVGGGTGRYQSYYYDGELESQDLKSTTTYTLFDMADVDPAMLIELLEQVRAAVDDPESWYVVISGVPELGPQIGAYASNEFGESANILVNFDGTVIYDNTKD